MSSLSAFSQKDSLSFWEYPDTLHKARFWTAAGVGVVAYTGTLLTLNNLWYDQYERTTFHLFNDAKEWQQMDKAGHVFTAYFESEWCYQVARWTGMERGPSIWAGALVAVGLQTTIEVLDGFSSEWGFSMYDFTANLAGAGMWAVEQAIWDDQRIKLKMSTTFVTYPEDVVLGVPGGSTTIRERTDDLYGTNLFQTFLKDYNAQTIWMSFNIHSFLKEESRFPKWLNVAVGYGAQNMYGGFENEWMIDENTFTLDPAIYPRYRQWYLSPDIDLSRLKVRSKFLKTLLCMANIFKFPAPALVINGKGGVQWDWLHY
jgi:hypothetical protein